MESMTPETGAKMSDAAAEGVQRSVCAVAPSDGVRRALNALDSADLVCDVPEVQLRLHIVLHDLPCLPTWVPLVGSST